MQESLYIELNRMKFYAYHGVLPQEQRVGNCFELSFRLSLTSTESLHSDDLSKTVSYAEVYQVVKEEMALPALLLESVAGRIAMRLLHDFALISEVQLRLSKLNPPMGADISSATIEVRLSR